MEKSNPAIRFFFKNFPKTKKILVNYFEIMKAFLIDYLLWFYTFFCLKFVVSDKILIPMISQSVGNPDNIKVSGFFQGLFYHFYVRPLESIFEFQISLTDISPWFFISFFIALGLFFTKFSVGKWSLRKIEQSKFAPRFIIITIILTFISGVYFTKMNISEFLSSDGLAGALRILNSLIHPNTEILPVAISAAIETVYMAFMATVLAIPFAFFISFFAARNLMGENILGITIYNITRFFLNLSRSIEPLVWAIMFSVWVGFGPFAGMLALYIHSVASLSKLYSEQIENINDGPLEAMRATGASPVQVVWYGVVPQILIPYLSFTIYRWDINVRMATVIGFVGGGGIGNILVQYQQQGKWQEAGLLVAIVALIVWAIDFSSARIRANIK